MKRKCDDCQLCCALLPMSASMNGQSLEAAELLVERGLLAPDVVLTPDYDKAAGATCKHQCATGCAIYERRPFGCRMWACVWLVDETATAQLGRPDTTHYVIDMMRDFITLTEPNGKQHKFPVTVVWADPAYPNCHRDPALRTYLAAQNMPALIRYNESEAITLFPPGMVADGWHEQRNGGVERAHSFEERLAAIRREK